MTGILPFRILRQPDDSTCGPTCLHAIYDYHGDWMELDDVIAEVRTLRAGGTLEVLLANHALRRGYRALVYTFNLQVFDPTWFAPGAKVDIAERLRAQKRAKSSRKLRLTCAAYIDFLKLGGELRMGDLNAALLRRYLTRGVPILSGLSATYLYQSARELGDPMRYDDVRGQAQGHFVVLCGYDKTQRTVAVADPLLPNPVAKTQYYGVDIDRLVCAIMLGIITYDASLLVIEPRRSKDGHPHRRREP
ncbi:MAG: peptidase-C39 like family protein [Planctomycetes bacterium]|nr:peptidase-C39 like family protein [Planctomycetota bacterium]